MVRAARALDAAAARRREVCRKPVDARVARRGYFREVPSPCFQCLRIEGQQVGNLRPAFARRALACFDDFRAGLRNDERDDHGDDCECREIPSTQRTTPVVRPCRASVAVFTGGGRSDIAAIPLLR